MSGLEIIGVVLGVIPIVVAAIKKCRERQTWRSFRSKGPTLRRLIQCIETQRFLLVADISVTLSKSGVQHDATSTQFSPAIFKDPKVSDGVDAYLGDHRTTYYEAVNRCHAALAHLVQGISGLQPLPKNMTDLVATYPTNGGQYELPPKIKFPIKREELDGHIHELETAISTLRCVSDSITSLKQQAVEPSTSKQVSTFVSAVNSVRNHAARLYSAISMAYPASCHSQHEARLFLESRSDIKVTHLASTAEDQLTITVSFAPAKFPPDSSHAYVSNITVVEGNSSTKTMPGNKIRNKLSVTASSTTAAQQAIPKSSMMDLCATIQQAQQSGLVLDIYLGENKGLTYSPLHGTGTGHSKYLRQVSGDLVPLDYLLGGKLGKPWLAIPKIALSLTLASSLLQLVSTPWLRVPLTSRSIRFFRSAIEGASLTKGKLPEPFVEESFATTNGTTHICRTCGVQDYIFELGILLLEIQQWKNIDDYRAGRSSGGHPSPVSRCELARVWVEEVKYDMLEFQSEAIKRCLWGTFATQLAAPDWDDPMLRKSIAEYVIQPLREHCPAGLR